MKSLLKLSLLAITMGMFTSCSWLLDELEKQETPTEKLMTDNMWKVTSVFDSDSGEVLDEIQLGLGDAEVPFIFNMKDLDEFTCTSGPLFLYIVYGDNNWTNLTGKIDQVFDYLDGDAITSGEWGIADGVVEKFTLQVKLQPPGFNSLVSILEDIFGLQSFSQKINKYVVHKFMDVEVSFEGDNMVWEITDNTQAEYFTRDDQLNDVPFVIEGNNYSRTRIEFEPFSAVGTTEEMLYNNLLD